MGNYNVLAELPGVALEKRQELMTPCTTQSSFCSAIPMAVTSSTTSVWYTFDIDHLTMVETCMALLIIALNYCSELHNLRWACCRACSRVGGRAGGRAAGVTSYFII